MKGLDQRELQHLILSVGTHRNERPLSPVEVSELLQRSVAAGSSRKSLAEELGVGATQVSTFLKLLDVDPEVRDLAMWGSANGGIPFSSMALLAQLPDRNDQIAAAMAILRHNLTWKEVVSLVQLADRSSIGIDRAIQQVMDLRPTIDKRYVLIGTITSTNLRHELESRLQAERDHLLDNILGGISPGHDTAGRLGVDRFTIVSHSDPERVFGLTADQLELRINEDLMDLV